MESPSPDTDIAGKNHTDGNSSEGKYRDFSIDSDLEAVQKLSRACHIICLTEPYDYEQGRDMIRSLVDVCDELLIRGEMFETLESKSKLFAGIYKDVTKMLEAISLSEEICVEVRALSRRQWKDHYHLTRPPFRAKLKPWNQFLSRNAPGSGTGVYCSDSKTLVQVLPPAAVQLLNAWQQDNHRLRGEMEQFMLGMPAGAGRNAATHFQRENLELAYSAKPFSCAPSPFIKHLPRAVAPDVTPQLEELGSFLHHLEKGIDSPDPSNDQFIPIVVNRRQLPMKNKYR